MKKIIIFAALAMAIVSALFFLFLGTGRDQIRKMKTLDAMGQISVALDRTLGIKPLDGYDPVSETRKIFSSISATNGQVIDGWGKPIAISFKRALNGFQVSIISSGTDGIMGTKDDLTWDYLLEDKVKKAENVNSNDVGIGVQGVGSNNLTGRK